MTPGRQNELLKTALQMLAERCPRLIQSCYWAGTAAVSIEELHHRQSFDLVDVAAVLDRHPDMEQSCRRMLAGQDAAILVERLIAWTDDALSRDLAAYEDVKAESAVRSRDLLLRWLKQSAAGDDRP
jgi:hypothetical protein